MGEADRQDIQNDELSAGLPTSAATYHARQSDVVWAGALHGVFGSRTTFEMHARGYTSPLAHDSMLPAGDVGPAPHVDVTTGIYSINTAELSRGDRRSLSFGGSIAHPVVTWGRHDLKVGVDYVQSTGTDQQGYPDNRFFYDSAGQPIQVELWDGNTVHFTTNETALYGQDRWSANRITVELGVRVDVNRGSVPGAGTVFRTMPISPRLGLAWDLAKDHRTVIRAHYGHYADPVYGSHFSFMDRTGIHPDISADVIGPNQFIETSREDFAEFSLAPTIAQPYVRETVLGLERQLAADLSLQTQYVSRRFEDFIGAVNTQNVWIPVQRVDPGPDGILGTADDGSPLTLFQLANPSPVIGLVTNPPDAFRHYDALQVMAKKRYAHDWEVLAGLTFARVNGTVSSGGAFGNALVDHYDLGYLGVFVDPNHLINKAMPSTSTEFKLEGTYHSSRLGGVNLSGVLRWQSGAPWQRTASFRGLGRNETVLVETTPHYLPAVTTVDVRVEKTVRLGTSTLGGYLDVFNLINQGVPLGVSALSGPSLGTPLAWNDPRTLRAGVRVTF
jgi:hypothetical protein